MTDDDAYLTTSCDRFGKPYPWMVRYAAYADEQLSSGDGQENLHVVSNGHSPPAAFSRLYRCLIEARETPEVWERILWYVRQDLINVEDLLPDDPRTDEWRRQIGIRLFIHDFAMWFRARNCPEEHMLGYDYISHALEKIARGELEITDGDGIYDLFRPLGRTVIDDRGAMTKQA